MDNERDELEWDLLDEYFDEVLEGLRGTNECAHCGVPLALNHQSDQEGYQLEEVFECPNCGLDRRKKVHSLN